MRRATLLDQLNERVIACERCPRLREWCLRVATEKRRSFQHEDYWGLPVPHFGDPDADLLIVGLAPAAHGGNRTGRFFTGDRSGDWLFRALHKAGLANQPTSTHRFDRLRLTGVMITAVIHCAPPGNKPLPEEIANCRVHFDPMRDFVKWRSVLCLGALAWNHVLRTFPGGGPMPFQHCRQVELETGTRVVASFHPSQQNTFTGKLTEEMLDEAIRMFTAPSR